MAKARKQTAAPLTVSRSALLVGGSDAEFRAFIHDLMAYGHRLDACREAFAAIAGVSPAQTSATPRLGASTTKSPSGDIPTGATQPGRRAASRIVAASIRPVDAFS